MNPSGALDATRGITEFNVGTGGYALALPTVAIHPNSQVRAAVYGVLSLTLRDSGYAWRFVPAAGQSFADSGSVSCHGAAPPPPPPPPNQPPVASAGGPYSTT